MLRSIFLTSSGKRRPVVGLVLGLIAVAIVWALERTAWASWVDAAVTMLLFVAAALMVRRNIREGQYRIR
jgi:cobalamin synthase